MQRISNNPDDIVDEMLKGFLKVHSDIVEKTENSRVMKAKNISKEKVGVIAGEVLMWKVGGTKVSLGANLDEVIAVAQKPIGHTRSVGIGLLVPRLDIEPQLKSIRSFHICCVVRILNTSSQLP